MFSYLIATIVVYFAHVILYMFGSKFIFLKLSHKYVGYFNCYQVFASNNFKLLLSATISAFHLIRTFAKLCNVTATVYWSCKIKHADDYN